MRKEGALDLVERAQRGDHAAFDQLVTQHAPALYRVALAVIGSDAASDVTQDTFLRAWTELASLRDPERFPAWLRQILVNRCRDVVRSQRGVRPLSLDGPTASAGGRHAPDPTVAVDRTADLQAALATLHQDQRILLALRYVADLPVRDVAATLGVPEGTVKSRLHAAIAALRARMNEADR